MSRRKIAFRTSLLCAGILSGVAGCVPQVPEIPETVPITTGSDEARQSYLSGRALAENHRIADARLQFDRALELDPDFALAHLGRANTATSTAELHDHLGKAVRHAEGCSDGERWMILGLDAGTRSEPAVQLEHYTNLAETYPLDERAQVLLATALFGRQEYDKAAARLRRAVELNPDFAPAYNMLGYAYRSLGQLERAEQAFRSYVERLPSEPNPHDSYAELLMKRGRFNESIESYRKALELDPQFIPSLVGIGNNQIFQGEFDDAERTLSSIETMARNDGERRQAHFWLAALELHRGKTDSAVDEIEAGRSLSERSGDWAAVSGDEVLIGNILLAADRPDDAATHYAAAVTAIDKAEVPGDVRAAARRNQLFNLGRVAAAKKDLETARARAADFRRLSSNLESPTETRQLYELTGLIALAEGDFAAAARALRNGDQENPRILYLTAVALEGVGTPDRAMILYAKAARFYGLNIEYGYVRERAAAKLKELRGRRAPDGS